MFAKDFVEIIMNDWLDDCELVVEVDGKQYAAKKVETEEVNGRRVCILVAEEEMSEEVTMKYDGIEQGIEQEIEVYCCSHCHSDVYHTIHWYDFCPSCGRRIKEWK